LESSRDVRAATTIRTAGSWSKLKERVKVFNRSVGSVRSGELGRCAVDGEGGSSFTALVRELDGMLLCNRSRCEEAERSEDGGAGVHGRFERSNGNPGQTDEVITRRGGIEPFAAILRPPTTHSEPIRTSLGNTSAPYPRVGDESPRIERPHRSAVDSFSLAPEVSQNCGAEPARRSKWWGSPESRRSGVPGSGITIGI